MNNSKHFVFRQLIIGTVLAFGTISNVSAYEIASDYSIAVRAAKETTKPYPLGMRAAFVSECLGSVIEERMDRQKLYLMTRFCLCMMDQIQETFTLSEYEDIDNNPRNQTRLTQIIETGKYECL